MVAGPRNIRVGLIGPDIVRSGIGERGLLPGGIRGKRVGESGPVQIPGNTGIQVGQPDIDLGHRGIVNGIGGVLRGTLELGIVVLNTYGGAGIAAALSVGIISRHYYGGRRRGLVYLYYDRRDAHPESILHIAGRVGGFCQQQVFQTSSPGNELGIETSRDISPGGGVRRKIAARIALELYPVRRFLGKVEKLGGVIIPDRRSAELADGHVHRGIQAAVRGRTGDGVELADAGSVGIGRQHYPRRRGGAVNGKGSLRQRGRIPGLVRGVKFHGISLVVLPRRAVLERDLGIRSHAGVNSSGKPGISGVHRRESGGLPVPVIHGRIVHAEISAGHGARGRIGNGALKRGQFPEVSAGGRGYCGGRVQRIYNEFAAGAGALHGAVDVALGARDHAVLAFRRPAAGGDGPVPRRDGGRVEVNVTVTGE